MVLSDKIALITAGSISFNVASFKRGTIDKCSKM